MSRVDRGTIELEMDGEVYELRPTLEAFKKIQARFGGLRGALEAIGQMNSEHLANIILAGTSGPRRDLAKIEEQIFNEGLATVTEAIAPFVTTLFNPRGDDEAGNGKVESE
jgi:hypothetical protein